MIVADSRLKVVEVTPSPKQTKVLGATLKGVGLVTSVNAELPWCFALVEDANGFEHHVFLSDLKKADLIYPAEPMPYREVKRRIGYGLFADMLELESVHHSDLTHAEPLEAVA